MPEKIPGPAYRIHTERLVIRCYDPADAALLKAAVDASIEHLRPWLPWAYDEPQTIEEKIALTRMFRGKFDLGEDFIYAIFDRDEKELIGGTGLHMRRGARAREIGYWVNVDHIGKGVATEASAALTKVAFEIDEVARVEIHCVTENHRSASVPAKLGYVHEATRRRISATGDGVDRDTMIWTLFADEYPSSPAATAAIEAYDAAGRRII